MDSSHAQLSVELEAALLRELAEAYRQQRWSLFKEKMPVALIDLVSSTSHLGRWVPATRTIEISKPFVLTQPWGVVVEVLKHEMAHQFVHEVLKIHDETAHGAAFKRVCQLHGIDAGASGVPRAHRPDEGEARVLERISKLLALAESSNANEAQSAMAAAQRLMLKYNLDAAEARAPRGYGFRHLGQPTGRVSEAERLIASILMRHFFVEAIWVGVYRPLEGKAGRVLEICGAEANLDMAEYVHGFLLATSEKLWKDHKRQLNIKGDRDRRSYLSGVMMGFHSKLDEEQRVASKAGLVWKGDPNLVDFYRRRHPRVQTTSFGGANWNHARASGLQAGKNLVLHKPVGGGATSRGRLLGQ